MEQKVTHFLYMPLLGLGLYGGHRGKRWLRNRVKIMKQFVVPSLERQSDPNFVLWVSARYEDRNDFMLQELQAYLTLRGIKNVFTYSGVCFWDDKYEDSVAHERLISAVHGSMASLINNMGEANTILMTIQPSDDVYHTDFIKETKQYFKDNPDMDVYGYRKGYVMDYVNRRLCEWNPKTTPPFYTIKFKREVFTDPFQHIKFTGPYKSHEYVKDNLKAYYDDTRGFLVGTHGENISTIFNHPYTGHEFLGDNLERILNNFALTGVPNLALPFSLRKTVMRRLPYGWRRKLRYLFGERFAARIYNFIRS